MTGSKKRDTENNNENGSSILKNGKSGTLKPVSDEVEPFIIEPLSSTKQQRRMLCCIFIFAVLFFIVGSVFLFFGLYKYYDTTCEVKFSNNATAAWTTGENGNRTLAKKNSDQLKFTKFLKQTFDLYYQLFPSQVQTNVALTMRERFNNYRPYDAHWSTLKRRTDHSRQLRRQLDDLHVDLSKLRPREKKAYAQIEHFLDHTFGNPYHEDYYAGDWMTGPNYGCWQLFCSLTKPLQIIFGRKGFVPRSFDDVIALVKKLKMFRKSVSDYRDNMVLGVQSGFVRSIETCDSGYETFKALYPKIEDNGAKGVLSEGFTRVLINPSYYSKIPADDTQRLLANFSRDIHAEVSSVLVEYLGTPLHEFLDFLKNNHSRHCVPADVASGLANLPLRRVWLDQNETDIETTQELPTGEQLDGARSYEMILPYFTTTDQYNATSTNALGEEEKKKLYKQIIETAVKITKKPELAAISELKADLNHPRHFFNTTPIPDNESGAIGGSQCRTMKSAQKNCPVRYQAMQSWFNYVNMFMSKLEPMLHKMFYHTGERATTPGCPIALRASFSPSMASHFYIQSDYKCSSTAFYYMPFFLKMPGPKYGIYSIVGHETRPGHHTQGQGFNEHFSTSGNNDVIDWLNTVTYYTAFTEGWALYAENPLLAKETNLYKDEPYQEYGMLKWQIWRALRLVIDTGLHSRGMTLNEALNLFEMFAWDTTDKSFKDSVRYMSGPGQATAYMIGQLAIWHIRDETEQLFRKHGIRFDVKEFHYLILSQGSSPLQYLSSYMKDYQQCKINPHSKTDCPVILEPKKAGSDPSMKFEGFGTAKRWKHIQKLKTQQRENHE